MRVENFFSSIPENLPDEVLEEIVGTGDIRIERILSCGHSSPDSFWYDQEKNEWVIILDGSAGLLFEGSNEIVTMKAGDYLNIPAHKKHRVEWTDPGRKTVWLAVHY